MSRLAPNSPLLKSKSQKVPHFKHQILIHMLVKELKGGWAPVTTREIADNFFFNINMANQILRRMRDYGFIKGHKEKVTTFIMYDITKPDNRKTLKVKGTELPDGYYRSEIIEKKTRKIIPWELTRTGREFAKRIWLDADKYGLGDIVRRHSKIFYYDAVMDIEKPHKIFELYEEEERHKEKAKLNEIKEGLIKEIKEMESKGGSKVSLVIPDASIHSVDGLGSGLNEQIVKMRNLMIMVLVCSHYMKEGFEVTDKKSGDGIDLIIKKDECIYEVIIIEKKESSVHLNLSLPELVRIKEEKRKVKLCLIKNADTSYPTFTDINIS